MSLLLVLISVGLGSLGPLTWAVLILHRSWHLVHVLGKMRGVKAALDLKLGVSREDTLLIFGLSCGVVIGVLGTEHVLL